MVIPRQKHPKDNQLQAWNTWKILFHTHQCKFMHSVLTILVSGLFCRIIWLVVKSLLIYHQSEYIRQHSIDILLSHGHLIRQRIHEVITLW